MITQHNIEYMMNDLNRECIEKAFQSSKDFILFEAHIFNAGAYATIEAHDYSEETEETAHASGQVFTDKDSFLQLFMESESLNPSLIELI